MRRSCLLLSAVVAVAAFSATPASAQDSFLDTVDLEVLGNGKIRGTLRSASERETFRLDLPEGTTVTAQAKRRGKGKLVPALQLQFKDATEAEGTFRGRGSKLRSPVLESSGDHLLRVFGNGQDDGDYQLAFKAKPRTRWTGTGNAPPGLSAQFFRFGAPAGAQARIRLTPARGSEFVPALEELAGPGFVTETLSGGSTSWIPLGAAGTYVVSFHDGGTEGGVWVMSVQLRIPRVPKSVIDISAAALTGAFGGTQQVFGAQIGPEGGIVDPPDLGGALDGSSVSIPEGSLSFPVVITINEAGDIVVPDPDTGAGPTIQFGPSGTEFEEGLPATITIPYDPSLFADPATELTVYVRNDETGEVEPVLPREDYDFSQYGLVSFPYPHFSSFVAAGSGPPSSDGDLVAVALLGAPYRTVSSFEELGVGDLHAQGEGSTLGWNYDAVVWYDPQAVPEVGPPGPVSYSYAFGNFEYAYVQSIDDRSVGVYTFGKPGGTYQFQRAGRGDVWLSVGNLQSLQQSATTVVAFRRTEGDATHLSLAGRWHMFVLSTGAENFGDEQLARVRLRAHGARATATLGIDGAWKIGNVSGRQADTEFPLGTWAEGRVTLPATASGGFDGDLYVEFPATLGAVPVEPPEFGRFRPCVGGDVLVGTTRAGNGDALVVIMVREAKDMKPSALAGVTTQFRYARHTVDVGEQVPAVGFRWIAEMADATRNLPRALSVQPTRTVTAELDALGEPSFGVKLGGTTTGTWSLAANGAYSDSTGMVGAVSPRGDFFVGLVADGTRFEWVFGIPGEQFSPPLPPQAIPE